MKYIFTAACLFAMLIFPLYSDEKADFETNKKAAESGDAKAQYQLALSYLNGNGVEKSEKSAFEWFQKAVEKGNPDAQAYLGYCYKNGRGVAKNDQKAFESFTKAAEQGNAYAQRNLGICYGSGRGVTADRMQAFEWFSKAAEQKDETASLQIACYNLGAAGFQANPAKAMEILEAVAENKSSYAQMVAAMAYFTGTCALSDNCSKKLVIGNVQTDIDKSIKYARMGLSSSKKVEKNVSAFFLMGGLLKKGEPGKIFEISDECPLILIIVAAGSIALIIGFILELLLLIWIYRKARTLRTEGKPWHIFDFIALVALSIPLGILVQTGILLPLNMLTGALIGTLILFGFCILFFTFILRMRKVPFIEAFQLKKMPLWNYVKYMLLFFLIIGLFGYAYEWTCKFFDIKLQNQIVADLFSSKGLSGLELGVCYFIAAIVIPVMEELIFRGIIFQSLKTKMRPWFAIILSSALFASMHMSLSFFFLLFVMGVLLAYSLEKTKSMYVPICLHCFNNAIMLCITLLSR